MARDPWERLRFLPIGLDVRGRSCVVVGGGSIGSRKVTNLRHAGAVVTVVAPAVEDELAEQIDSGWVRWMQEPFREEHLDGAFLAVAATDDEAVNAAVVQAGLKVGSLVCDASSAERSQVIFGALLQDEGATIAVFTDGRDPAQARRVRDRIAELMGRKGDSGAEM